MKRALKAIFYHDNRGDRNSKCILLPLTEILKLCKVKIK
jgi:hypothetical protein